MNRSLEELPVSRDVVLYSVPKCGRTWVRYMYMHLFGEHLAATHFDKNRRPLQTHHPDPQVRGRIGVVLLRDPLS